MKKVAVCLLTGCIEPPAGLPFTNLTDPDIRKAQYIEALTYYLKSCDLKIVFSENSGHDLSHHFEEEVRKERIEFLDFHGNNYPLHLGKGVGEFNCLDHANKNSFFIQGADFVFKITGRYIVKNLHQFIRQWRKRDQVFVMTELDIERRFAEARFFGFHPSFINEFLKPNAHLLNDTNGFYFEHFLFEGVNTAMGKGRIVDIFNGSPRIVGIAGSMNMPYQSGYLRHLYRDIKGKIRYHNFHRS